MESNLGQAKLRFPELLPHNNLHDHNKLGKDFINRDFVGIQLPEYSCGGVLRSTVAKFMGHIESMNDNVPFFFFFLYYGMSHA